MAQVIMCSKCHKPHKDYASAKNCIGWVLGYCDVFCGMPPDPHLDNCLFLAMSEYCQANNWKFGKRLKPRRN